MNGRGRVDWSLYHRPRGQSAGQNVVCWRWEGAQIILTLVHNPWAVREQEHGIPDLRDKGRDWDMGSSSAVVNPGLVSLVTES